MRLGWKNPDKPRSRLFVSPSFMVRSQLCLWNPARPTPPLFPFPRRFLALPPPKLRFPAYFLFLLLFIRLAIGQSLKSVQHFFNQIVNFFSPITQIAFREMVLRVFPDRKSTRLNSSHS